MASATQSGMTPLQIAVATNSADALARMEDKILPETWELNRWLLASLLALNSAAAGTIYTASDVSGAAKMVACRLFIAGALFALGSGFVQMRQLPKLSAAATEAQHYWAAVAGGFARSPDMEAAHVTATKLKFSWAPQVMLIVSAICFIGGILQL